MIDSDPVRVKVSFGPMPPGVRTTSRCWCWVLQPAPPRRPGPLVDAWKAKGVRDLRSILFISPHGRPTSACLVALGGAVTRAGMAWHGPGPTAMNWLRLLVVHTGTPALACQWPAGGPGSARRSGTPIEVLFRACAGISTRYSVLGRRMFLECHVYGIRRQPSRDGTAASKTRSGKGV